MNTTITCISPAPWTQLLTPQNVILAAVLFILFYIVWWMMITYVCQLLTQMLEEFSINWRRRRLINYNEYLNNGNQREVSFF